MGTSRIQSAKPAIVEYFNNQPIKIFKPVDLGAILTEQRSIWALAKSTTLRDFVDFLSKEGRLVINDFPFPYRQEVRYVWGVIPLLEILLTLKPNSYFTHSTAMRIHDLSSSISEDIYLNHEQRPQPKDGNLEQGRIDAAFKRKARESNNVVLRNDFNIHMLNGMHTNQLGVIEKQVSYNSQDVKVRVTNVERTLIDIAVRPVYAGGVANVQAAYLRAKEYTNVRLISDMLQKLSYVYPYHQSIGYYLEKAGHAEKDLDLLRQRSIEFDFYLAHQMEETEYEKNWRLHVPKIIS